MFVKIRNSVLEVLMIFQVAVSLIDSIARPVTFPNQKCFCEQFYIITLATKQGKCPDFISKFARDVEGEAKL